MCMCMSCASRRAERSKRQPPERPLGAGLSRVAPGERTRRPGSPNGLGEGTPVPTLRACLCLTAGPEGQRGPRDSDAQVGWPVQRAMPQIARMGTPGHANFACIHRHKMSRGTVLDAMKAANVVGPRNAYLLYKGLECSASGSDLFVSLLLRVYLARCCYGDGDVGHARRIAMMRSSLQAGFDAALDEVLGGGDVWDALVVEAYRAYLGRTASLWYLKGPHPCILKPWLPGAVQLHAVGRRRFSISGGLCIPACRTYSQPEGGEHSEAISCDPGTWGDS